MNSTEEKLGKRLDDVESQLAFLDELVERLNTVVAKQELELIGLKRQVGVLTERLKEIGDAAPGAVPQDETPPHY
jgi:SlyX protein